MPRIPAICEKCQAVFPSAINLRAPNALFLNCSVTCPKCGGMAKILDGVYTALGDALYALLQEPNPHLVIRLIAVLEKGKERQESPEQIRAEIARTAPELRSLADILPRKRGDLYVVMGLIISALALVLSNCGSKPTPQEINQYIDNSINIIYRSGNDG